MIRTLGNRYLSLIAAEKITLTPTVITETMEIDKFEKLFNVPIKNDAILAYHWSIKMYTGLTLVI